MNEAEWEDWDATFRAERMRLFREDRFVEETAEGKVQSESFYKVAKFEMVFLDADGSQAAPAEWSNLLDELIEYFGPSLDVRISDKESMALESLNASELAAKRACQGLIAALFMPEDCGDARSISIKMAESEIARLIKVKEASRELTAARVIREGLNNLQAGKPFKSKHGKRFSIRPLQVLLALKCMEAEGYAKPAAVEIRDWLGKQWGLKITRAYISQIVSRLKIQPRMSKATGTPKGENVKSPSRTRRRGG